MFNEHKRNIILLLQKSTDAKPIPVVDADTNDGQYMKVAFIRRALQVAFGNGSPDAIGFRISRASSTINNFQVDGGEDTIESSGRYYVGGYPCLNEDDVDYTSGDVGTPSAPGDASRIHHVSTAVTVDTLQDTAGCFGPGELVDRFLVPNIDPAAGALPYQIVANTADTITVNLGGNPNMDTVASAGDYYRINLLTPTGGDRRDFVWLDAYIDEIDVVDDPTLNHNIGSPPSGAIEACRRGRLIQRVFVNERGDGLDIKLQALTADADAGATVLNVTSGTPFASDKVLLLGCGRNEERVYVQSVGVNTITLAEPLEWDHFFGDWIHQVSVLDSDLNRHYFSLLAVVDRLDTNVNITSAMITDYREQHWGSSAEVRDLRRVIGGSAADAFTAMQHVVTLGTGVGSSIGDFNVVDFPTAEACFNAAIDSLTSGGVVWIKPGTYTLSSGPILLDDDNVQLVAQSRMVRIDGAAGNETILVTADRSGIINGRIVPSVGQPGILIEDISDLTIENIRGDGTNAPAAHIKVNNIYTPNKVKIKGCNFDNGTNGSAYYIELERTTEFAIDHCTFSNAGGSSSISISNGSTVGRVRGCVVDSGDYGIHLNNAAGAACSKIRVLDCVFTGLSSPSIYVDSAPGATELVFRGLIIRTSTGIFISEGNGIDISAISVINPVNFGLKCQGSASPINVRGLWIENTGGVDAIQFLGNVVVQGSDINVSTFTGVSAIDISGNVIASLNNVRLSTGQRGIVVSSAEPCHFADITCWNVSKQSIRLSTDGHTVEGFISRDAGNPADASLAIVESTGNGNSLSGVRVEGFEGATNAVAIQLSGIDCSVNDFFISNGSGTTPHGILTYTGTGASISNGYIEDLDGRGIGIGAGGNARISDVRMASVGQAVGFEAVACDGWTDISNIDATGGVAAAIRLNAGGNISDSSFTLPNTSNPVVEITGAAARLENVKASGGVTSFKVEDQSDVHFYNCKAANFVSYGFVYTGATGIRFNSVVRNCEIQGPGAGGLAGIFLDNSYRKNSIVGCYIDGNASMQHGVDALDLETQVSSCKVINTTQRGVRVRKDDSTVSDCDILVTASGMGIEVGSGSGVERNFIVDSCWVNGGLEGVWVRGEATIVTGCRIKGFTNFGININITSPNNENVVVGDCFISSSASGVGIFSNAAKTNISNVHIQTPALGGIQIQGNSSTVEACTIEASGAEGIEVDGASYVNVSNCLIKDCVDVGIRGTNTEHIVIEGNRIIITAAVPNPQFGIGLVGGNSPIIAKNQINGLNQTTAANGINVSNCTRVIAEQNRISICNYGIHIDNGDYSKISENNIDSDIAGAIRLVNSDVSIISKNHSTQSGGDGIDVDACGFPTVEGNVVVRATLLGLRYRNAVGDGFIIMSNNQFHDNSGNTIVQVNLDGFHGTITGNILTYSGGTKGQITFTVSKTGFYPLDKTTAIEDIDNHNFSV